METFRVRVGAAEATCAHVKEHDALSEALEAAGLPSPCPVLVIVGGAGGLDPASLRRLSPIFSIGLGPAVERVGAVAVDGGTDAGVMRLLGEARMVRPVFFLVGVAAEGTVRVPGRASAKDDAADLEPHHTHFFFVPGDEWGAEAPWIAAVASRLAGSAPSVTVLINGGDIAYRDVTLSLSVHRPVIVIAGSGRAADGIAAALRGEPSDPRAQRLAASDLVSAVEADNPVRVYEAVTRALSTPTV